MGNKTEETGNIYGEDKLNKILKSRGLSLIDILNRMNLGVGIFDCKKNEVVFLNRFFSDAVSKNEKKILDVIWSNSKDCAKSDFENSTTPGLIELGKTANISYGFSSYRIFDGIHMIFLNEITSKAIASKSKMDNFLYDKMSEMIAEISHEIGNPLAGISTMLELIISKIDEFSKEKFQNYLERTFEEITRLTHTLRKIRRVYTDDRMDIEDVDLKEIVDEVYRRNSEELKNRELIFENRIREGCFGRVDRDSFYQIIKNFFDNSTAVLKKGQKIEVSDENVDNSNYIRIAYMNNGNPIPEKDYEKIFLPLFSTREEGSGLGLFISLKLMTRMGGTIKIVPPDGDTGVKFLIFVPRGGNNNGKQ